MKEHYIMKKKIVSLCLVVALAATAVIGGTLAYFSDKDAETNVFIVGDIDIDLHESNQGVNAGDIDEDYHAWLEDQLIMPGIGYDKHVWVENTGKNPAYVRLTTVVPNHLAPTWNDAGDWTLISETENVAEDTTTYVYGLTTPVAPGADTSTNLTFVTMDYQVTELTAASDYKVTILAEAIQSESFVDSTAAYAALDGAYVANIEQTPDADKLNTALLTAQVAQLPGNIDSREDIIMTDKEAVLDGNGYVLNKETDSNPDVNAGVQTNGGTIKNITITSTEASNAAGKGFRAVYGVNKLTNDLIIEDSTLIGTYALNLNGGATGNESLTVKNSTLDGWVSYGTNLSGAEFIDCKFVTAGNMVPAAGGPVAQNTFRPYVDTVLTGCDFVEPYIFSAGTIVTIELNNCTVGGNPVTAANFATIFEMGSGIADCTVIVDGVTVVF